MKCPKCGAENPDDSLFCQECGTKFAVQEENSQAAPKKKSKKAWFAIIGIVIMAFPIGYFLGVKEQTATINTGSSSGSASQSSAPEKSKASSTSVNNTSGSASTVLSVSKTTIYAPAEGVVEKITVSGKCSWDLYGAGGHILSATRKGNIVTVKVNSNTSGRDRSDFFYIKTYDGSQSYKITILQAADDYSDDPVAE